MTKRSFIRSLPTACYVLLFAASPGAPQNKTIYGTARSIDDNAIAQTEIRTDRGASDVTTDTGKFGFPLVPPLKIGFPVIFYVTGWAVVEPCASVRGRTYLPHPDADEIMVRALRKGDKRLLSRGPIACIMVQKAAQFVRPARPLPPTGLKVKVSSLVNQIDPMASFVGEQNAFGLYPYATIVVSAFSLAPSSLSEGQDLSDDFLQEQSTDMGFSPDQLSAAILEWIKSATDPYELGLAAFYEGRYSDASRLIQESITASPKGPIDRYVSLARAEYEQKHYDAARSALSYALSAHPDDPLLLQDAEAIDRAQKSPNLPKN